MRRAVVRFARIAVIAGCWIVPGPVPTVCQQGFEESVERAYVPLASGGAIQGCSPQKAISIEVSDTDLDGS